MRRLIPAAVLAAALSSCSLKNVASERFEFCRAGACRPMAAGSREELLRSLYSFFQRSQGKDLLLSEAKPGESDFKGRGIHVYTQGGPMPGSYKGKALRISDVLYLDVGEGVIKFKGRMRGTYLWVPVLCAEGTGTITLVSATETRVEFANLCTWMVAGTSYWKLDLIMDRLDMDAGLLGARYSLRGAGPLVAGGGRGYLLARLGTDDAQEPAPAAKPPAAPLPALPLPAAPPPAGIPLPAGVKTSPNPAESVEELSSVPVAALAAKLKDAGGDSVIDAGEAFTLSAAVTNTGVAAIRSLRVIVTGTPALLSALAPEKDLGPLAPGAAGAAEFSGTLPAGTPSQAGVLRVEALSDPGGVLLAAKTFKVALRGRTVDDAEVLSELDVDEIPAATKGVGGPDDAALVVGISRYRDKDIPAVRYAARDAELVGRYLARVAGVPAANIKVLTDDSATKSDLEAYLGDWLPRRVKPSSRVFVYFAGHGSPALSGGDAFLVPFEGQPDFPTKLMPLKAVMAALEKLPAKETVVMLDSCFSGTGGRSILPAGARPLVTTYAAPAPAGGRTVVLSAAAGSQVSSDYDKARHGLFTYALLRGLRGEADADGDGAVTVGELFGYAKDQVSRRASLELNRDQTPTLNPAASAAGAPLDIRVSSTKARR